MTYARIGLWMALIALPLLALGCGQGHGTHKDNAQAGPASKEDPEVKAAMAKLSPEDRAIAEAQKFCAFDDKSPLGKMGKPYKILIKGQPVFLCCDGCEKEALAKPDETLATAKALKEKSAANK